MSISLLTTTVSQTWARLGLLLPGAIQDSRLRCRTILTATSTPCAWSKCAHLRPQSEQRILQGCCCQPTEPWRTQYFDFDDLLDKTCPEFDRIDWRNVKTRLLIGASEVVNGFETVFDSDVNKENAGQGGLLLAPAIAAHSVRGRRVRNVAHFPRG